MNRLFGTGDVGGRVLRTVEGKGFRDRSIKIRKLAAGVAGEEILTRFLLLSKSFRDSNPGVQMTISSESAVSLLEALLEERLDVALVSGRPRCEGQHKDLIATRIHGAAGWLWVVRRRIGRSALADTFEKYLVETCKSRMRGHKAEGVGVEHVETDRVCVREIQVAAQGHGQ